MFRLQPARPIDSVYMNTQNPTITSMLGMSQDIRWSVSRRKRPLRPMKQFQLCCWEWFGKSFKKSVCILLTTWKFDIFSSKVPTYFCCYISLHFMELFEFHVFRRFWPILANQKTLLWHVWDSRNAFLPFGTHILRPWTPSGDLLGLPWAPCAGQFDPPGPMLENYRKTTKTNTFLELFVEPFCGRWHMQSVHACAVQTHMLHLIPTFFWASKRTKDRNGVGIQSRHLRHIPDKGGTWEASGRHLGEERSESRMEAQSQ